MGGLAEGQPNLEAACKVASIPAIAVCSGIDPSLCRGLDDTSPYVLT
jgi:hypothetical protein